MKAHSSDTNTSLDNLVVESLAISHKITPFTDEDIQSSKHDCSSADHFYFRDRDGFTVVKYRYSDEVRALTKKLVSKLPPVDLGRRTVAKHIVRGCVGFSHPNFHP
jgi:hypothetical protein